MAPELTVQERINSYISKHPECKLQPQGMILSAMAKDGIITQTELESIKQGSAFGYGFGDSISLGLEVEHTQAQVVTTQTSQQQQTPLTTEQAQDLSISYLSENLQNAIQLYMTMDNGIVSEGYDDIKNFFETKLSSKNVGEVIDKEQDCISFLMKAKEGQLTKKEYYEKNKSRLKEMMMARMLKEDEDGRSFLDILRGSTPKEKFEKYVEQFIQERIDTIATIQGFKDAQHQLIMMSEEEETEFVTKLSNAIQQSIKDNVIQLDSTKFKINIKPQQVVNPEFESTELMTFEETYKLERGTTFSEEKMEQLQQKQGEMNFVTGAYNKFQGLKSSVDKIMKKYAQITSLHDEAMFNPEVYEPDASKRKEEVLKVISEYYAVAPENAVKDLNKIIEKQQLNISFKQDENGALQLEFSQFQQTDAQKNSVLNKLLHGIVQNQKEKLNSLLGGKPVEKYIEDYTSSYINSMGKQNADELAQAMQQDNMTVVDATTGFVSMAGLGVLAVGGVVACLFPELAMPVACLAKFKVGELIAKVGGGIAFAGMVGRNALGFTEAYTRDEVQEEEVSRRYKDLAMDVGGMLIGGYAGKMGLKYASEIARNGGTKAAAFVAEHGTDFTISVLGDLAMIGVMDYDQGLKETLKQNGIGIIVSTITGVQASKAIFAENSRKPNLFSSKQNLTTVKPQDVETKQPKRYCY